MKRRSDISGTGSKSGQVDTTPPRSRSVFITSFLVLGASFLVLGALTIGFYQGYIATGRYSLGLLACLSSVLATAVLIGGVVLLSLRLHAKKPLPRPTAALISTLQRDPDPGVRAKAAEGLAELELELPPHDPAHNKLDDILISTLQRDPDPRVRAKAAEGLAELELEQSPHDPAHNKLDDTLFEDGL